MTIIDLDHTLIQTDLLWEQAVALIIEKPWTVFYLPFWLLSGRLHFKLQIAKTGSFEPQSLPYRSHVLERIEAARKSGQTTVLASASPDAWIQSISAHLGIFDHAFGSQDINLKGEAKWAKIKAAFSSNGENPKTEYFGDSGSDLAIWKNCAHAVAINPSRKTLKRLAQLGTPFDVIRDTKGSLKSALKQLRPHQWVKNLLLFIPLLAAHHFLITSDDAEKWGAIALAFFSFSAAASSIYILNDLIDLQSDRNHPTKKARPLASGDLSIPMALGLLTVSAGAAIVGGAVVSQNFSLSLLCYFGLNLLYSLWLKRAVLIDVVLLAAL
ncbi:UbiA family prenyltransferase, partial [Bdellovibrionota bacterium FG-2]